MASTRAPTRAANAVIVSKVRDSIKRMIETHFSGSLGREKDIINIVNAMVQRESSFRTNVLGDPVGYNVRGTGGRIYMTSSAITAKLATANSTEEENIKKGLRAIGILQVMGWNFVKGGSLTGKCEIERIRPDLAPLLTVEPGEDPSTKILGDANLDNAILAGLIILEGKYRAVYETPLGYSVRGDSYKRTFFSKISGAVAAYLGLGRSDLNNTTPEAYSSEIVGGSFYVRANGPNPSVAANLKINVASSNGPSTNGSNQGKINGVGCTPVKKAA